MDKKALTLLEILVSCMLLAFVLTGLANVFVIGKRYTLHSRSRIQVAELGKFYLEPLQLDVRQSESAVGAQDGWDGAENGLTVGTRNPPPEPPIDGITYTPTLVVSDVGGGTELRRVIVTINWNEPPS